MTTAFGRPLDGSVTESHSYSVEQWSDEQFIPLLDTLLDQEGVVSVMWRQYTPYFADGDPCEFSVGDSYVKLVDTDEEDGEYGDGYLGSWELRNNDNEALVEAVDDFSHGIGHFEILLKKTFGDHAQVWADKTGFRVEFYEHD